MKKNIILLVLLLCSTLFSNVYIGFKGDVSLGKSTSIVNGPLLKKIKNLPDIRIGGLFGVMFPSPLISPFIEADIMITKSKVESESIINGIKEYLSIKKCFEIGIMPGVQVSWVPLVSWFGAIRMSLSKVEASPVNMPVNSRDAFLIYDLGLSNAIKSTHMLGIEPMLGAHLHLADTFTMRLAVAYIYIPSKTLYKNYFGYRQVLSRSSAENITFNQSGFCISAALIYNF